MADKSKWKQNIQAHFQEMTNLEQEIATYFLYEAQIDEDLSALGLAEKLHVSKAALTRFAKKIGFRGYREFVFYFSSQEANEEALVISPSSQRVLDDYMKIQALAQDLLVEEELMKIAQLIDQAERVYFFGKGSSGLVARELKLRLMRLGVVCEALTERDSFAWTTGILDGDCLVIAFSLSGETRSVIESLVQAGKKGAKTVLLTAGKIDPSQFDHLIPLANIGRLHYGQGISPQIPMLLMVDLIYSHFLEIDREKKEKIYHSYWENKAFSQDR